MHNSTAPGLYVTFLIVRFIEEYWFGKVCLRNEYLCNLNPLRGGRRRCCGVAEGFRSGLYFSKLVPFVAE